MVKELQSILNFIQQDENISTEDINRFYQYLLKYIPGLPEKAKEFYFDCPGLVLSTVLLENVGLYIENFLDILYSDEKNKITLPISS